MNIYDLMHRRLKEYIGAKDIDQDAPPPDTKFLLNHHELRIACEQIINKNANQPSPFLPSRLFEADLRFQYAGLEWSLTPLVPYVSQDDHIRSQLRQLALEFHYQCEMFDRSVCSGSNRGIAMPTRSGERNQCDANAMKVRDDLYESFVVMLQVSPLDWRNAISDHAREFEQQFRATKPTIPPHSHEISN